MDLNKVISSNPEIRKAFDDLKEQFPNGVKLIKNTKITSSVLVKYSFMLISYQNWNSLVDADNAELHAIPSTLIINKKESRFHSSSRYKTAPNVSIDPIAENL